MADVRFRRLRRHMYRVYSDTKQATVPVWGSQKKAVVPADAMTASGPSLGPHISISIARAELQAPHVAKERGPAPERVMATIGQPASGRSLGFRREPAVNVLELNSVLDEG